MWPQMDMKANLKQRFVILDGLRGLAAFIIVPFHIWLGTSWYHAISYIFVDFFFVLSGFVLAPQLYSREKRSSYQFLVNRVFRLYPILIPVFVCMIFINETPFLNEKLNSSHHSWMSYLGAFLLFQIFIGSLSTVHGALWSLSAEIFVNIVSTRLFPSGKKIYLVLVAGYFILIVGIFMNHRCNLGWTLVDYFPAAGRVIIGFYLGLLLRRKIDEKVGKNTLKNFKTKLVASILLVLLNCILMIKSEWYIVLAGINFYWAISLVTRMNEEKFPNYFSKTCSYLGRISYGVYVWNIVIAKLHVSSFVKSYLAMPSLGIVDNLIDIAITISLILIATEISIHLFENPIRKWAKNKIKI